MASARIPVTITYHKAGTQPPVYVAGSFSDPAWEPQEMKFTTGDDGEKNSNFKPLRFGLSGRPLAGYQGSSPHFIGQKLGPNDFKPQPGVLEPLS